MVQRQELTDQAGNVTIVLDGAQRVVTTGSLTIVNKKGEPLMTFQGEGGNKTTVEIGAVGGEFAGTLAVNDRAGNVAIELDGKAGAGGKVTVGGDRVTLDGTVVGGTITLGTNKRIVLGPEGIVVNGVAVGTDAGGINYPNEYESIGLSHTDYNLRLQSPNAIFFHPGQRGSQPHAMWLGYHGDLHTEAGKYAGFHFHNRGNHNQYWGLYSPDESARLWWSGDGQDKFIVDKNGAVIANAGLYPGFYFANRSNNSQRWAWYSVNGEARLWWSGDGRDKVAVTPDGDLQLVGADCAEDFDVVDEDDVEPGMLMVIASEGALRPCEEPYDKKVAGVISGAADLRPGIRLGKKEGQDRQALALTGKVFCRADAHYGCIETGDLLTTSPTRGCAMKATDPARSFGAVIGKALGSLESGQNLIPVLVALQ